MRELLRNYKLCGTRKAGSCRGNAVNKQRYLTRKPEKVFLLPQKEESMTEPKHSLPMRELLEKPGLHPRNTILSKKRLAPNIYEMEVYAPIAIHNAEPGQFVNVIVHEHGKSVPLTIADSDEKTGTLTLVFQAVGVSTMRMATLNVGDTLYSIRGPLGVPSEIEKYDGMIICVAGGVGIAPMYPVVRALKEAGNEILLILGAREEKFLFWEEKIRPYADKMFVCIEEGETKEGRTKGRVTPTLVGMMTTCQYMEKSFHVFGVGPIPMLQAIMNETKPRGVKFIASAVASMVDGTGMCFGCQYNAKGKTFRLCVDGPEVDGNDLDWDTLKLRLNQFRPQEAIAMEEFKKTDLYQKYLAQEEVPRAIRSSNHACPSGGHPKQKLGTSGNRHLRRSRVQRSRPLFARQTASVRQYVPRRRSDRTHSGIRRKRLVSKSRKPLPRKQSFVRHYGPRLPAKRTMRTGLFAQQKRRTDRDRYDRT